MTEGVFAKTGFMSQVDNANGAALFVERLSAASACSASENGGFARQRVIHISKHCARANGSVHVAVDLACVQAKAGYEVTFASGGGTFVPMLEQHGVRHVTMQQEQRKPWTLARSALQLIRLCRDVRPTVLHAHMMGAAVIGYIASRATGVPLVTTVHNSFDWHSFLMRLGDQVVAVSHAERDHLVARGFNAARTSAVWNAPDRSPREAFLQNSQDFKLQGPCVVAICALHRRKGVFDIINACASLFTEFPDWRLYIAGEGPDREVLEQQVADLGLAERIVFLGFVQAPGTLFAQSDIFVLASYADPGSLSIGEARAAGCAIIATAVGGTTEMLEFGEAGLLVSPGSPRQLAVQLRRLMRNRLSGPLLPRPQELAPRCSLSNGWSGSTAPFTTQRGRASEAAISGRHVSGPLHSSSTRSMRGRDVAH